MAHYTGFEHIPYDTVDAEAIARLDEGGRIVEMDRHARVIGPVTDEEMARIVA